MRPSGCKGVSLLLLLLAGLHTAALCRAGTTAAAGSITTVPVGGTVRFPLLHHSQESFEVVMGRIHPDLAILGWKSNSPEYPHVVHPSYMGRVLFRQDAFIELRAVGPSDQGTYEVQTSYFGSELRNRDRENFVLCVVEPMSTPTVEVSRNSSHLTLNCSTVSGCLVTYRWELRSQDPGVGNATFPGAVLHPLNTWPYTYTCVTEDCCSSHAATAKLLCDNLLGGSWSGGKIAATVLIPAAAVLILIILAVWLCLRHNVSMKNALQRTANFLTVKSSVHGHSEVDSNSVEQQETAFLQSKGVEEGNNNIEACHPLPREIKSDKPAIIII